MLDGYQRELGILLELVIPSVECIETRIKHAQLFNSARGKLPPREIAGHGVVE
jgi:hypothetical protein